MTVRTTLELSVLCIAYLLRPRKEVRSFGLQLGTEFRFVQRLGVEFAQYTPIVGEIGSKISPKTPADLCPLNDPSVLFRSLRLSDAFFGTRGQLMCNSPKPAPATSPSCRIVELGEE